MRRFEFQANAANEDEVRRWQTRAHPIHAFGYALGSSLGWFVLGLAALYVYHAYLNYHSQFAKGTAFIEGHALTARNIILIVDKSGSMVGTEERIKQLRERLQRAGISVRAKELSEGFGFGVATQGAADNALNHLEQALRLNPSADAVYLFSDFETHENDLTDDAGYARLRELFRQGRRRLYLGTVRDAPSPQLIQIARESRGDVIESK
jgi:hypothetical protein